MKGFYRLTFFMHTCVFVVLDLSAQSKKGAKSDKSVQFPINPVGKENMMGGYMDIC